MATLVPDRTDEGTEQSSDLISLEEDYNPFLPAVLTPTAPPARPPLPPRDSPTGNARSPSAPAAEVVLALEKSESETSDLYIDESFSGNPFSQNTSTVPDSRRQARETGGARIGAPSPPLGRPSLPPLYSESVDVPAARARGRSADVPSNLERSKQKESKRRPSVSPVSTRNVPSPVPSSDLEERGSPSGSAHSSVSSKPKSPGEARRRSGSLTNGRASNGGRDGLQGRSVRPPLTPPRTGNSGSGNSAAAAAAAAAAAMAVAAPPTRSGGGGSAAASSAAGASAAAPAPAAPAANSQKQGESQRSSWNWHNIGRIFGVMMGNALEGAQQGKKAAAGRRVARELSSHVMQQKPDGKYHVSVWKRNKQGSNSILVSVGLYDTAYEGQRAAEAYAPPVWQEPKRNSTCAICDSSFGLFTRRRHHCRNCGRLVCSVCSEATWPRSMLPPTYQVDGNEKKIRICDTCCKAGERFRKALLSGSEEQAMEAYSTGCVNLRTPYTIYHNELPVHCAAAGGNLNILAWLVEDRCCPLFLDREKKVALGDSNKQSVMGAAAASGHMQIMRYLAFTQGCKVTEIKSMHILWGALEKFLYEGADILPGETKQIRRGSVGGEAVVQDAYRVGQNNGTRGGGAEVAATVDDEDNMCIVCFEKKVDCTLVPCGHLCCCMSCAAQFDLCPVCRAPVDQKIRAITV